MIRALNWYQQHLREFWTVAVTIILAGVLRFYWLPSSTNWNGDTARDMIVARHLAEYHEPLNLGHSAYGLRIASEKNGKDPYGMSHYPSYFLKGMGTLWAVTGSELNLMIVVVLYQLLGLVVLYLGLRQIFGWISAEMAIALISVSSIAIGHSLGVAIHLALPLLFLVFTLFVTGIQKKQLKFLAASALLCVAGTLIHYSFLLVFAWILAAGAAWLWRAKQQKTAALFAFGMGLAGTLLFFGLNWEVIRFYGFQPFLQSFFQLYQSKAPTLSIAQNQIISLLMFRLSHLLFDWKSVITAVSVGVIWMAGSGKKSIRFWLLGLFAFAACVIFFVGVKDPSTYHFEQVVFFDYTFLVLFGVSLGTIFTQAKMAGKLSCLLILGGVVYATSGYAFRQPIFMYMLPISVAKSQAQQLIEKNPYPIEDTEFYVSSYYSWDYESPTVIFWLETLSGKKLVKLVEAYNNLDWAGEPKKHMIVSCQRFPKSPSDEKASCEIFVNHYTKSGKYELEKELFSNENYRAFLFKVK